LRAQQGKDIVGTAWHGMKSGEKCFGQMIESLRRVPLAWYGLGTFSYIPSSICVLAMHVLMIIAVLMLLCRKQFPPNFEISAEFMCSHSFPAGWAVPFIHCVRSFPPLVGQCYSFIFHSFVDCFLCVMGKGVVLRVEISCAKCWEIVVQMVESLRRVPLAWYGLGT
jgi:hypothetical protein